MARRFSLFLLTFSLLLLFASVSPAETQAVPWRDYSTVEISHERVELFIQYNNESAVSCVIGADEGTIALDMTDGYSFAWDSKRREAALRWSAGRLEFDLSYMPAISPDALAGGEPYRDELIFTYYDANGDVLNRDRVTIEGALHRMLVKMESARE